MKRVAIETENYRLTVKVDEVEETIEWLKSLGERVERNLPDDERSKDHAQQFNSMAETLKGDRK